MRIVQGSNASLPSPGSGNPPAATHPVRLDALEKIAQSILERIQKLEEKIDALDQAKEKPDSSSPPPEPATQVSAVPAPTIDLEAVKKGLLSKMWKHLNDERPPKAA